MKKSLKHFNIRFFDISFDSRTVRRWKDKLNKLKDPDSVLNHESDEVEEQQKSPNRPVRLKKVKVESFDENVFEDNIEEDEDYQEDQETNVVARKKRRLYVDREKVQYARELIENKLSNKEMSMLLEMSIG